MKDMSCFLMEGVTVVEFTVQPKTYTAVPSDELAHCDARLRRGAIADAPTTAENGIPSDAPLKEKCTFSGGLA